MRHPHYKNYICIVDRYRPPSMRRNTTGRYRVGAKNSKQAKELLQNAIGFGHIQVYYEDKKLLAKYKEVWREIYDKNGDIAKVNHGFSLHPVRHATDPIDKRKEEEKI